MAMTRAEALEEARDKWGDKAFAEYYFYPGEYAVGVRTGKHSVWSYGTGRKSFDEAFRDAKENGY